VKASNLDLSHPSNPDWREILISASNQWEMSCLKGASYSRFYYGEWLGRRTLARGILIMCCISAQCYNKIVSGINTLHLVNSSASQRENTVK
jgi:hypothetical protein